MVTEVTKSCEKVAHKFVCKTCDYETSKKSSYDKHLLTDKHTVSVAGDVGDATCDIKVAKSCFLVCEKCNKSYNSRNGLWKHKKICINVTPQVSNEPSDKELIMMLIKENSDLKHLVLDVCQKIQPLNNTVNSHNVTNNKTFNLQLFLNETCKDAMNIMDFVESIKLQLCDLENVGKLGYVEGISKIIVSNLNLLDETKRPVHCADSKREVMYVKDEDKWEKEDENKQKLRNVIKYVTKENTKLLKDFRSKHPGCDKSESNLSNKYDKLMLEAFGGKGDDYDKKEDKIIRNIVKHVTIDKTNL